MSSCNGNSLVSSTSAGLTKREYFAAHLFNPVTPFGGSLDLEAVKAVNAADTLIKALNGDIKVEVSFEINPAMPGSIRYEPA